MTSTIRRKLRFSLRHVRSTGRSSSPTRARPGFLKDTGRLGLGHPGRLVLLARIPLADEFQPPPFSGPGIPFFGLGKQQPCAVKAAVFDHQDSLCRLDQTLARKGALVEIPGWRAECHLPAHNSNPTFQPSLPR